MDVETPAEKIGHWLNRSGPGQTIFGWLALVPCAVLIFLFGQLIIAIGLSWIGRSMDGAFVRFTANTLNAALGPFLIIRYGSLVALSFRRRAAIALALIAVTLVGLFCLAAELSPSGQSDARYLWLAVGAVLCTASVWRGLRSVWRAPQVVS